MSGGIDMLHNYGPLRRTNNGSDISNVPSFSMAVTSFDYQSFRQQFEQLLERIIILAGGKKYQKKQCKPNAKELQTMKNMNTADFRVSNAGSVEVVEDLPQEKGQRHEILNVQPMRKNTSVIRKLHPLPVNADKMETVLNVHNLESVEDDDGERHSDDNNKDMEDLSGEMGYRKTFGCKNNEVGEEKESTTSPLSCDRTIPINESLFSDLGIWW